MSVPPVSGSPGPGPDGDRPGGGGVDGVRSFLGLGSNMGDRQGQLRTAVESLPDVVAVSPVYETEPVGGPPGQDRFLNVVVELDSELTPRELLEVAHRLEERAGRVRTVRDGPRTLDVDVLLVGDLVVDEPDLVVPHPRMWERRFVVAPLSDLAPDLVSPSVRIASGGDVQRLGMLGGY
jgi:2-amino-4-hydroxy-6-hydroxymethyldihydropteridine diphosphokinase